MKILGVLLLAAGSVALWVLGRNYGLCHQWFIDPTQYACRVAGTYHAWGVVLMVAGGLALLVGLMAGPHKREPADRINIHGSE